jgi:hypothetical protein
MGKGWSRGGRAWHAGLVRHGNPNAVGHAAGARADELGPHGVLRRAWRAGGREQAERGSRRAHGSRSGCRAVAGGLRRNRGVSCRRRLAADGLGCSVGAAPLSTAAAGSCGTSTPPPLAGRRPASEAVSWACGVSRGSARAADRGWGHRAGLARGVVRPARHPVTHGPNVPARMASSCCRPPRAPEGAVRVKGRRGEEGMGGGRVGQGRPPGVVTHGARSSPQRLTLCARLAGAAGDAASLRGHGQGSARPGLCLLRAPRPPAVSRAPAAWPTCPAARAPRP